MSQGAYDWLSRLNAYLGPHGVCILCRPQAEPKIEIAGSLKLHDDLEDVASQWRETLRFNDLVAILTRRPNFDADPVILPVATCDYAAAITLAQASKTPQMLSASALVICSETGELVLHRRSEHSRDCGGALHSFGGSYIPPVTRDHQTPDLGQHDSLSLIRTLRREALEESGIDLNVAELPNLLLIEETRTEIPFLQFAVIGVDISEGVWKPPEPGHEGAVERIRCQDLEAALANDRWMPSGKAHVLAWLALGAPNRTRTLRFGGLTGEELFDRIVPGT